MSIVTIAYLLIGLVLFESALTIHRLHPKASLNRVCALLILLFAVFCFSFGLFTTAQNRETAWILAKISLILSCFMGSLILHFLLVLGNYEKPGNSRIILLLLYSPAITLSGYGFVNPLIISDIVLTPWGWDNVMSDQLNIWESVYLGYTLAFVALGLLMALRSGLRTRDMIQKRQVLSLIGVNTIGFLMVIFTFMAILYNYDSLLVVNLLVGLLILIWLAGLRYVMWTQKLFVLLPQNSSKGLFSGVKTPILLADEHNTILFANSEAKKIIFNGSKRDTGMTNMSIESLIENYQVIDEEINKIKDGQLNHLTCIVQFAGNENGYYHLNIHPIRNEQDIHQGNMMLINPVTSFEGLRKKYNLTAKEIEIVQLVDKGLSVPNMAKFLDRSELTIKTHIHNIYRKTGVNNRVHLSQLTRE